MKKIIFCLGTVLFISLNSATQASMAFDIRTEHERYIRYEKIKIRLVLRNDSGNNLDFGSSENPRGKLRLYLENGDGELILPKDDPSAMLDKLSMPSGATKTLTFTLNNYFPLTRYDHYKLYAQIGHERFNDEYRSRTIDLQVHNALTIWEKTFGIPDDNQNHKITHRKAELLRFQQPNGKIYCLRISDEDYVYIVHRLARHISHANPRGEIDARSNIHIFIRIKSRIFMYQIYNWHGERLQEKFYTFDDEESPRLQRDPETGSVNVVGGRPAARGEDYDMPDNAPNNLSDDGAPLVNPL